jgi:ABC-type glycerol-3-phosphate transport system substrate-binding protein
MKKMKKPLLLAVSMVLLLATVLAGCSNSGGNDPKPASTADTNTEKGSEATEASADQPWVFGSSPLEFSAYTHYGWQDFPETMDAVPFWKYLKENKQVNIKSIQAKGNQAQVMTTMMASGDLPDLIYGDRYNADIERLIEGGKLVALDPYLDKYPNLKKWLDPKLMDLLRSKDGKLYKFPNWYTEKPTNTAGYVVNKKIYAELGSPTLETIDDLYGYLVKVKEKYGDKVVPFEPDRAQDAQGVGLLYTAFGEGNNYKAFSSDLQGVVNGDKITSIFTDPSFRESQKFVSKLYREKLISQDMFTQVRDAVLEKLMTGRVAVYAGSSVTTFASQADKALKEKDPTDGYFMIWPIHKAGLDKNKIHPGGWDRLGWNITTITTSAKEPEKIFAFLDWMTGPEGMTIQFFGPEGGNWKGFDENEQPIFTDTYNAAEVVDIQGKNDPVQIVGNTSYIDPAKMKYENSKPLEEQNWQARFQRDITWPSSNDITALNNMPLEPDSPLGDTKQQITDLFLQVLADSSTAKSDADVDKILDKAEADAKSFGYEDILKWRTEKWLANKAILGE